MAWAEYWWLATKLIYLSVKTLADTTTIDQRSPSHLIPLAFL